MVHALHATRSSHEKAVCLSIRLSDKRVHCDKTKGTCAHIRKIIQLSFTTIIMVGGGDPFYLKFWVKLTLLEQNGTYWKGFMMD